MEYEIQVKLAVYRSIANTARVPTAEDIASQLGSHTAQVEAAFQSLALQRLLVLEPGSSGLIRMAPPFSGIPTPFLVDVAGLSFHANCVWDALGVPAALGQQGQVRMHCAHSGVPLNLQVDSEGPELIDCRVHFAVPAALWWEDIIFT